MPTDAHAAVLAARDVLASPGLHDELTLLLARGLVDLHERAEQDRAWALDVEDEADRQADDARRARVR